MTHQFAVQNSYVYEILVRYIVQSKDSICKILDGPIGVSKSSRDPTGSECQRIIISD